MVTGFMLLCRHMIAGVVCKPVFRQNLFGRMVGQASPWLALGAEA